MALSLEAAAETSGATTPVAGGGSPGSHEVLSSGPPRLGIDTLLGFAKAGPMSTDTTPPRTPSLGASIHARQSQEREIYSSVRRHMEVLEERLGGQIARVQQQSERSRDSALTRMESKIGTMELLQPKVDRRLAELNGNLKALSEESQTQIRRMDQMDSRLWEWRHKLDEEIRGKLAHIEQGSQELASSVRVTKAANEDVLKRYHQRLLRLEQLVDERGAQHEDFSSSLMNMHARLLDIEHDASPGLRSSSDILARDPLSDAVASAGVATLEAQVQELTQKVQQLQEEGYDLRGRLESQQEHHKAMRAQLEAKDDQIRSLDNRMNCENWEGRLKDLQRSFDDSVQGSLGHSEHVQILQRRIESHEEAQAELSGHIRRLQERQAVLGLENTGSSTPRSISPLPGLPGACSNVLSERLDNFEDVVSSLQSKVDAMLVDMEVAPRVSALVDTLKDVSPKIIGHEESLKDLGVKISAVEGELRDVHEGLSKRVGPMQAEIRDCLACQAEIRDEATGLSERFVKLETDVRVLAEVRGEASEGLTTRLTKLEQETCPQATWRLDHLSGRMDKLEAERLDHLSGRMDQLEAEVHSPAPSGEAELRELADDLALRVDRLEAEVHGAPGYEVLGALEGDDAEDLLASEALAAASAPAPALPAPVLESDERAPHPDGARPVAAPPAANASEAGAAAPEAGSPLRRASSTE